MSIGHKRETSVNQPSKIGIKNLWNIHFMISRGSRKIEKEFIKKSRGRMLENGRPISSYERMEACDALD